MSEAQDGDVVCSSCESDLSAVRPLRKDSDSGRVIATKFKLLEKIGVGAMGSIWRAEQLSLGKIVGVKLLHRHLLSDNTLSKRFHREARAAARLSHPNAITILDFGQTEDDLLYIAMEFIDGQDLAQLLHREGPLPTDRVVHIMKQVCGALDEAHAKAIIHRDLKPENIMVTEMSREKDFVKVLDFGIAKIQDRSDSKDSFQTMAGIVCGTPEYMSPEQARGEELDARSDLYAIGVILYQLTTGKLPFVGDSPIAVVTRHLTDQPRPPREINPELPQVFESLILRLMAKKRDMRPPNALALLKELEAVEMALGMLGDTVQHPSALSLEPRDDGGDKTAVVQRLPSDLIREMDAAVRREADEARRQATSDAVPAAGESKVRKSSALPRPPVAARRVARSNGTGPRRYTPTHIDTRSFRKAAEEAASRASDAAALEDAANAPADRTLVQPGIGNAVIEEVRREAAARKSAQEAAATATPSAAAPKAARESEADMHSQRTVALTAREADLIRAEAILQSKQKKLVEEIAPRRGQAWVVYVLAIAAVLGVGGFLLVRYVF